MLTTYTLFSVSNNRTNESLACRRAKPNLYVTLLFMPDSLSLSFIDQTEVKMDFWDFSQFLGWNILQYGWILRRNGLVLLSF